MTKLLICVNEKKRTYFAPYGILRYSDKVMERWYIDGVHNYECTEF